MNSGDTKIKKMLYGFKASIIEANKYLTQKECLNYIVSFAMYTPLNMDKETGMMKKCNLRKMYWIRIYFHIVRQETKNILFGIYDK